MIILRIYSAYLFKEMIVLQTLDAMGRENTLEAIKEESGRNTRISALNQSREFVLALSLHK